MTVQISRRNILKSTAFAAAGFIPAAAAVAQTAKIPSQWDETTDIIIVGSGFAGLSAAVGASNAGAKVIILEKMPTIGGNSVINAGDMCAVGTPQQAAKSVKDSPELLAQDMLRNGLFLNDPKKVKFVAEHANDNYKWLVDEIGVEFMPVVGFTGGHSVPRAVTTTTGSGSGIIMPLAAYLKKKGIEPRTRNYVERIYRDDNGRVVGLCVREGYRFGKEGSGRPKNIQATKAVLFAHGGFGADVKYRSLLDPKLTEIFKTTNQPGATSEMWKEAARIGGMMIQSDWIQCTPWNNPLEKGMGYTWNFGQYVAGEAGIWVNTEGKRFVNENANRKVRADAILVEQGKGLKAVALANKAATASLEGRRPGFMDKALKDNLIKQYDSLDALAADWKMPADALKASIAQLNGYFKDGKDPQFGRIVKDLKPMEEGPWYAMEMSPKVHHCMGGLATTIDGKVLDVSTLEPIPGLYAAGEATGGTHGAVRMGTNAILDCLVMGRAAGTAAATQG
ncbi:flavocytochrome c [Turicimonas muris]|uniref:flavocytochrome c n=1 Tax=Turicimonas muris TaxID=1796652 RepID=UPI0024959A2B|nr:flavocytochrome c [Turicimonas muris]